MLALSEDLQLEITAHGLRVAIILLVGILTYRWLARALDRMESDVSAEKGMSATIYRGGIQMFRLTFFIVIGAFIFSELGFASGPIIASLGILGLAFSFGAQYIVRDMLAGLFLLREGVCHIGDVVTINSVRSHVESMHLRTLALKTETGSVVFIPYGEISMLENYAKRS